MNKKFLVLILLSCALLGAPSTKEKISDSKKTLRSSEKMSLQLNKKLDELASDIINGDKNLKNINADIAKLKTQISVLEGNATEANKELKELTSQNKDLMQTQKEIEQNIVRIIAEDFSLDLILDDQGVSESEESIVATQILAKLNNVLRDDFKKMAKDYEATLNLIKNKSDKINKIEDSIKEYKSKQSELLSLSDRQKSTLENLRRDKEIYTKKLAKLQSQQDEIRKTLEELSIIAKREDEEAARAKEQAAAAKKADSSDSVRQVGSGYQKSTVKRYTGAKTIAPLDNYTVKQKFGNYVDPIYNIKIFNESVVLRSNTPDEKVKSVLNGKVVFAKQTPLLENVVIVENENNIHTIYAHLSHIAPNIKVGTRVQKGAIIGRIRDELTFEVTQKNYHIDPLELIGGK
ncbi:MULTISPECIES: murein hydrolase activator EnvC family protein [unclassified Campylobacter]|uniref:murein hydrolase activator EnvC family protein n=1 Tax=unclassified Campylobacter TaxID=2593542 RepID=UPI003D339D5F